VPEKRGETVSSVCGLLPEKRRWGMTKTKREFPRFATNNPECPRHGSTMRLVSMARTSWMRASVIESLERQVWRCAHAGCARVERDPNEVIRFVAPEDASCRGDTSEPSL
jgi:hypothetical protein